MNHTTFGIMGLFGLLCPLLFFVVMVIVIVTIVRTVLRGSRARGGMGSNVPTQLAGDGFWLLSCPASRGSIIHYHYWADGVRHSGETLFEPAIDGRQFIYTGLRPEQVAIIRIIDSAYDNGPDIIFPPIIESPTVIWDNSSNDPPDNFSSSPPPSSFPTAY